VLKEWLPQIRYQTQIGEHATIKSGQANKIKGGVNLIKMKWTEAESRYFSKPIKTAERTNEWSWWGIFIAMIIMEIIVIAKIIRLF